MEPSSRPGLAVHDLTVCYGGNVAVRDVSLACPLGRLTGLIGPNGAGKTTIFNACSGLLRAAGGSIDLFGADVTSASPAARARRGLGRTFQRVELVSQMTVAENIGVGVEARNAGRNPFRQWWAGRRERAEMAAAVDEAVALCHLGDLAGRQVAELSTGQLRLVELARAYAGGYRFLLLDEPSSGLDPAETEAFGAIVQAMIAARGFGVLLVEHDMALVMRVCEHIYVLDFGLLIFDGSPAETLASETVRAAYLGSAEVLKDIEMPVTGGVA
jgi:ABC-type branched-subunit amino acid transport system ATPase component